MLSISNYINRRKKYFSDAPELIPCPVLIICGNCGSTFYLILFCDFSQNFLKEWKCKTACQKLPDLHLQISFMYITLK